MPLSWDWRSDYWILIQGNSTFIKEYLWNSQDYGNTNVSTAVDSILLRGGINGRTLVLFGMALVGGAHTRAFSEVRNNKNRWGGDLAERLKMNNKLTQLTDRELKAIRDSLRGNKPQGRLHDHAFYGKHIKFGYYSDPHCGEKHFLEGLWYAMVKTFKKEGIQHVYCPGDNLEGMSGRPGHIYELSHIGASAQLKYASSLFNDAPQLQFHITDGNHDQWFKEKGNIGLVAGQELQSRCNNVEFLGEWEAKIKLAENVELLLFHANDGTA